MATSAERRRWLTMTSGTYEKLSTIFGNLTAHPWSPGLRPGNHGISLPQVPGAGVLCADGNGSISRFEATIHWPDTLSAITVK